MVETCGDNTMNMNTTGGGLILHVGLPKTGTTTLQRTLFAQHSQIYYLGKFIKGRRVAKGCRTPAVYDMLKRLLWNVRGQYDQAEMAQLCRDVILPGVKAGQHVVGSWEALGNRPPETHRQMLERVVRTFGTCRLMVTLRNPLTQVPSEYLQNVEGKFIRRNRDWMGWHAALPLDEWFRRRCDKGNPEGSPLNYVENIRISTEMLGHENVGVFLFEGLVRDPASYYTALSRFIGIDADECLSLSRQKHFNKRLTEAQLALINKMESSSWGRVGLRCLSSRGRSLLLKAGSHSPPANVQLSDSLREEIVSKTSEGHRWLMNELGLPLDKYGYPLLRT